MLSNDVKQVYDLDVENLCKDNDFDSSFSNFEELDQPITLQEEEYAIHKLCNNKAMGSNCLMNEIFIESSDITTGALFSMAFRRSNAS